MKKIIALVLSLVMMFGCIGVTASAASIVGGQPVTTPTQPVCPPTTQPSGDCEVNITNNNITNNNTTNNTTNNYITIMPEQDPTTVMGFLYRLIKTIVPYLYKILSMLSIDISFNANNAQNCGNCGNTNKDCDCNNNCATDCTNNDYVIIIPSVPTTNGKPVEGTTEGNGNVNKPDSDSGSGILGELFGDLFAGSES